MSTTRLIFLRHGKLDLPYSSHDEMPYRLIIDLATRTMDPPLDMEDTQKRVEGLLKTVPFAEVDQIFASTFQRNKNSAQILAEQTEKLTGLLPPIEILPELDEMRMDVQPLFPHDLDTPVPLPHLMDLIFEDMIHGRHVERVEKILTRVKKLFERLRDEVGTVICVSHDNTLRVVELYVKAHGNLDASQVTAEQLKATTRKDYLRGFMTDGELNTFTVIE